MSGKECTHKSISSRWMHSNWAQACRLWEINKWRTRGGRVNGGLKSKRESKNPATPFCFLVIFLFLLFIVERRGVCNCGCGSIMGPIYLLENKLQQLWPKNIWKCNEKHLKYYEIYTISSLNVLHLKEQGECRKRPSSMLVPGTWAFAVIHIWVAIPWLQVSMDCRYPWQKTLVEERFPHAGNWMQLVTIVFDFS